MAMTDFTIIRRSLLARLFSTVTTIVSVAVAVALMLVLLSMKDSGQQAFERGSGNMHLLVSGDSSPLTSVLNGIFYANPPSRKIPWARFQEIAADPRITGDPANPALSPGFAIPNQQGDSYRGAYPTVATTPELFARFRPSPERPWVFAAGRAFEQDWEVVLGSAAARDNRLKVGDTLFLTHGRSDAARRRRRATPVATPTGAPAPQAEEEEDGTEVHKEFPYAVVGILEPTGSSHDRALFTNLQSTWIIHANERIERENPAHGKATAADLSDSDRNITGIYIRCVTRPGSDASAAMPTVASELRRDSAFTVADPTSEIRKLFAIVGNVNQILLAMAAVVMVSSGIGIMLALYNSMEQRRRQIAVLRVLGCSRPRIFGLVVTESALLGVLGGAAGLAICLVGVRLVTAVMKEHLGLVIEPVFALDWVLGVLAGTVVLAAAAGIVPAVMAYRTSVAKNLRPMG